MDSGNGPPCLRTALAEEHMATSPMRKEVAKELFIRCTDDNEFNIFATQFGATLRVIPLHCGSSTTLAGGTTSAQLLLAPDELSFHLLRDLVSHRLVCNENGDSSTLTTRLLLLERSCSTLLKSPPLVLATRHARLLNYSASPC